MRKSIGRRLFMQIMAVLMIFVIIALLANTLLIKPVYSMIKRKALITTVGYINSLEGDYANNLDDIYTVEEKLSAKVLIYDEESIIYLSGGRMVQGQWIDELEDLMPSRNAGHMGMPGAMAVGGGAFNLLPGMIESSELEVIDENTNITTITLKDGTEYLYVQTQLNDGANMVIVAEMQSLSEAVRIFNFFLLISAAICMLISALVTYLMSRKFVSPITNMNEVTKKIANLDFSSKVETKTRDELKELGDNINMLSYNLESTIAELKDELDRAHRLEKLRKNFVSTVSHELKTPISLLQGYAIGLTSDVCDEKEKRDYYSAVIADESRHLGDIVNELMDLTQMEAGYITLHEDSFALEEYLEELIEKYRAANPNIEFIFEKHSSDVMALGDIKLIERVLSNYLSNAIRHTEGEMKIKLSTEQKDDRMEVSVFNTGKHIKEESLSEIWNSFYRADDTGSRKSGGHGLGLAIVKNIQMAHGMGYGAKNTDGGVVFSFEIKRA